MHPDTDQTQPIVATKDIENAIEFACKDVFSTMLRTELTVGQAQIKTIIEAPSSCVITLVGLAGQWSGTGSLTSSGEFACKMASRLLGAEYESVGEDVLDAVSEITNMVIGNVKTILEEKLGPMGLSTPTAIYGRNFQTRSAHSHDWVVVPFALGESHFSVQICLIPRHAGEEDSSRTSVHTPQVWPI